MKKVAKWTALTVGVLAALSFLGLLVMVTRPAILTGVSGERLARSVYDGNEAGSCSKLSNGNWECHRDRRPGTTSEVEVDWMGCWESKPERDRPVDPMSEGPGDSVATGCIELGDIVTFD